MPVNRKFPLDLLFESLKTWQNQKKQMITFEYILIEGINDSVEQAEALARRARSIHAKVNLIPYNPNLTAEIHGFKKPSIAAAKAFGKRLMDAGIAVKLRKEFGSDIAAACGQLRREHAGAGSAGDAG